MRNWIALVAAVTLSVSAIAYAQRVGVIVDTRKPFPTVKVVAPGLYEMCRGFATELGVPAGTKGLTFGPRQLPHSQSEEAGLVWVVGYESRHVQKVYYELPNVFKGVRRQVASRIRTGNCYLEDELLLSYLRGDVVFEVTTPAEAEALATALR